MKPGDLASLSLPPEAQGGHLIGGPKPTIAVFRDLVDDGTMPEGAGTFFTRGDSPWGHLKHPRDVTAITVLAKGDLWVPVVGARVVLRVDGFPLDGGALLEGVTGGDGRILVPVRQSPVQVGPGEFTMQVVHLLLVPEQAFRVEVRAPEIAGATGPDRRALPIRVVLHGVESRGL